MSDKPLPFVINDRRKFNSEGELRPESERAPDPEPTPKAPTPISEPEQHPAPHLVTETSEETTEVTAEEAEDPNLPPPPTAEQMEQARLAFEATAERLEIAIRSANPGMDHPPAMSFEQIVQSVYMQSIMQLGGGAQEGQQPQVDILGAKQSIDMLAVLSAKTAGNLAESEQHLIDSALFELRLAFLEITQALARSAQARATQGPPPGGAPTPGGRPGPSLIR
ncbi:DUF1844 domain-containing protein [Granulicella tundricola]|uniref:DUF1844 domain-containing protein n=1 Tax=Granulicella tundricola (strain ATCC BAA-1859 / DSM 23138 / MP5ACTX9) TaxID=1198114 RepID=E8WYE2_GRATM|nr:DUF1844 domain-containing protein [Granulicella tundricola]ADW69848.1 Domain of unknown function DUF1844 [Granulicella tundricola MP5ACTX9]